MRDIMARVVLGLCLVLAGCDNARDSRADVRRPGEPLRITCTIGMIGDLAERIGGRHVRVTALMGPGVDPHLYKATAGDNARLAGADLVLYNGLKLEGKMTEVFEALAKRKPVVAVADAIDPALLLEPPEFAGHHDPHVWFDVSLWMRAAGRVRDALVEHDPVHASDYRNASRAYLEQLQELHDWCGSRARELTADRRILVTSHDAYNYFGRAYGFRVIGVQGISTEEQATARSIVDLSNTIKERRIKAIFTESSVSPKAIRAVIENCQASGWDVVEGGRLFSDAMDARDRPAGNYIGMIRHNMNTIVDALK